MVEFQMAKRVGVEIERYAYRSNLGAELKILPYVYPKIAALVPTFDCEGKYGGGSTTDGESIVIPKILDVFKEVNFTGTFNFVGKTASEYPEVVKRIHALGNDVWGHGLSHKYLDKDNEWDDEEVSITISTISHLIGENCTGWRSPYGTFNENLYYLLLKQGVTFGSNWGNSTWGSMPFYPIINGKRIDICELPFDDVHFDAMIFRKIGLSSIEALNLYKSKLLASINSLSIFTTLVHPVNLAEDIKRLDMFIDFLKYSSQQENIWVTSCSRLLKNYKIICNIKYDVLNIKNNQYSSLIELELSIKNTSQVNLDPITLAFRVPGDNIRVETNSKYTRINFKPYETILCFPIDLSIKKSQLKFEVIK